ncbi:MAG: carboxypeptidase regulatory-like domain-containing protein [Candidatus Binatia bacterium]
MQLRTARLTILSALVFVWAMPASDAAAKAKKYHVASVANGGVIAGKVTWEGSRPHLDPFPINRNADVCDPLGKGQRPSNRLMIDKAGGVENAVVFLKGVTRGKPLPKGPFALNQQGCDYHPHILVVPRRSEVTLKSSDNVLHNVHMFGAATYNIPFPKPVELRKRLRKSGVVRLQCDAGHGWMTAYIHVADHPYYAITGTDGAFRLTDVPPGKYTVHMWHEHWKITDTTQKEGKVATYTFADPITQSKSVEVTPGGTARVNFTMRAAP